jgi:hypothetical protein
LTRQESLPIPFLTDMVPQSTSENT